MVRRTHTLIDDILRHKKARGIAGHSIDKSQAVVGRSNQADRAIDARAHRADAISNQPAELIVAVKMNRAVLIRLGNDLPETVGEEGVLARATA